MPETDEIISKEIQMIGEHLQSIAKSLREFVQMAKDDK